MWGQLAIERRRRKIKKKIPLSFLEVLTPHVGKINNLFVDRKSQMMRGPFSEKVRDKTFSFL